MRSEKCKRLKNYCIIVVVLLYFLLGTGIYKDYGISTDEPTERTSTLVNVKYLISLFDQDKASEMEVPDLMTYDDRYYGTILQMPAVILEVGERSLRDIFYGRHLYTFALCVAGYVAFFFLCRMLFKSDLTALTGTAMVALYPRFFAEQFYNIKDMVFVSVFMISMFATVKLIESRFRWKWLFVFTISAAVSTNVRIVGIIFLILMLGYLLADFSAVRLIKLKGYEAQCKRPFLCGLVMLFLYIAVFVLMLPATWENPLKNVPEVFAKFSQFDKWDSTIVFMGRIIGKSEIPWYYIPVWMLISLPLWYIFLAVIAVLVSLLQGTGHIMRRENITYLILSRYKYHLWCVLLIAVPWFGIVFMHSTLYNGWRHCYFFVPPFVLFSIFGVNYIRKKSGKFFRVIFAIILIGGSIQLAWIWNYHPYEMVYLNNIGKFLGADFDRDYWHMATLDAFRYISENETGDTFSVGTSGHELYMYMLEDWERDRIEEKEEPLYYIETYRGKIGNNWEKEGYEEIKSIIVDSYKILTIYKKNES